MKSDHPPSHRLARVTELLKREIGTIIRREMPVAHAGLVTVNDVEVTSDLKNATVFIGIIGNAEQKKAAFYLLQENRKHIQGLVGKSVVLKFTPHLRFIVDDALARGNKVLQIIEQLEQATPSPEPQE